jgi:hypothetical protein
LTQFWALLQTDPFLGYTLLAALFLAVVSLGSGWSKLDFLAMTRPNVFFQLCLAVMAAFLFSLLPDPALSEERLFNPIAGLSRLPLYILALAYGPSTGLTAGLFFLALINLNTLPSWPEMILLLELLILGWLAIDPSAFRLRWAGPFNALLAYGLAWLTAGASVLEILTAQATQLKTHWLYHQPRLFDLTVLFITLTLLYPEIYRRFFSSSRIAPASTPIQNPETLVTFSEPLSVERISKPSGGTAMPEPFPARKSKPMRQSLEPLILTELGSKPSRLKTSLVQPVMTPLSKAPRQARALEPIAQPPELIRH